MNGLRTACATAAIALAMATGTQAAEQLVQVGSDSPDDDGTGSICIRADTNIGYAGLKQMVADNVELTNAAKVADVWVTSQVVAVEFNGATGGPVEAMMPTDLAERHNFHPCPPPQYAAALGALALGGGLAAVALDGDGTTTLVPVGGLAPPRPPVPPVPPGPRPPVPPGPPFTPPGPPPDVPPVSPQL